MKKNKNFYFKLFKKLEFYKILVLILLKKIFSKVLMS